MGACMLSVQRSLVEEYFGCAFGFTASICVLHVVTVGAWAWAALCDPGQLDAVSTFAIKMKWPNRSHKAWQYDRPIMRYDHYCRWLANCIGLRNHREFIVMITGFVVVAASGCVIDIVLLSFHIHQGLLDGFGHSIWDAFVTSMIVLHLVYSLIFGHYLLPIFRLHMRFVSRNELAQEWKHDLFYIVRDQVTGEPVWVKELDADEFDEHFDYFEYDPARNAYDKGCPSNCWTFWRTTRMGSAQKGDF